LPKLLLLLLLLPGERPFNKKVLDGGNGVAKNGAEGGSSAVSLARLSLKNRRGDEAQERMISCDDDDG